ncbi:MAG: radical SAM protein [Eubacterium sp.]|nr:radical SAM protein [Eubacterium sp.]
MKWKKKGHEYDHVYEKIREKKSFYLFGAGDYGKQFLRIMEKKIHIKGYIDNNPSKEGRTISGKMCYSLRGGVKLAENEGMIVTMSQIARVRPIEQLEKLGYKRNEDFFMIEEFLSIYHVYQNDSVYLSSISFLPSTVCNLKCRYCLNFNPFTEKFFVREWDALIKDIDLFFTCVDQVMLFHVSGGEPLLYNRIADLVCYIDQKYGNQINTLRMITNGTVVPKDRVLEKISGCRLEIIVDDYQEAVPSYKEQFDTLLCKLDQYRMKYSVNKAESWIDLAPEKTDYTDWTDAQMEKHRENCSQSWQELREGKLYSCNYASYASVAGISGSMDMEEAYDLAAFTPDKKKELVEFRLGYTSKGYTNFCRKCRGFTVENSETVRPAVQMR